MEYKGDIDAEQRIREISRREPLKQYHQEIRQELKPRTNEVILHLEVPNDGNPDTVEKN